MFDCICLRERLTVSLTPTQTNKEGKQTEDVDRNKLFFKMKKSHSSGVMALFFVNASLDLDSNYPTNPRKAF